MLGGAPEVGARAAASGGDEAERCAALTKDTKNHKGTQRKATQGRAVRVRKAHVRPEGPVRAWRASHATLWFWESSGEAAVLYVLPRCFQPGHKKAPALWEVGAFLEMGEAIRPRGGGGPHQPRPAPTVPTPSAQGEPLRFSRPPARWCRCPHPRQRCRRWRSRVRRC